MQQIEQEVARRTAQLTRTHNDEVVAYRQALKDLQNDNMKLVELLSKIQAQPVQFGNVIKLLKTPDAGNFARGDSILVVDQADGNCGSGGKIISDVTEGEVDVELTDGTYRRYSIGSDGKPVQVRLVEKADGTAVVVCIDGKPWEVRNTPELELQPGDHVKVHCETRQIIAKGYDDLGSGIVCSVEAVLPEGVEVADKGDKRFVQNPQSHPLEEGDRVVVDPGYFMVVRKLPKDARQRYKLKETLVSWDDIGGLEEEKKQCRDAIELPFLHRDIFDYYHMKKVRGILLHGPQGCGKTLFARAMATAVARMHGDDCLGTGFIYVKSPEVLDKWVGNSEAEIRNLFNRGRRHFYEKGYPAILVFDEFDAIAPQRGMRRSSDISDTIVPMFLGEMDGVDAEQTRTNPIVIVMSNRPDILDGAVIRPGRIDRHIRINRPDLDAAKQILQIHTRDVPFAPNVNMDILFAVTCQDIFSKSRLLYRINNEHDFTFADVISGAMLEEVCQTARMQAINRDITEKARTGINIEDFRFAVQKLYNAQSGLNHTYELRDFAEKKGIQPDSIKVERCFTN